ncbi:class II glutamine amidotransferase [Cellulomonas sp. zg-ZUI199]|uniref:Class II glutamine amidotransferase n=1 Tax=Cellulomonas wangleii TaxID=2816956 RepID=A0ABX8D454_9CELL|nr:class II glutamine amidotransferase [Cellulomonas wangleii]MBO0923950.1 class II glutamine amidotransferase [Cellulomonas wangleii]MBO0924232.1 class II glutamine amidotransferase [Cellulomonas wangleii]QVI62244.1 class II glutamine amidotransferase [Cellulomonas wangleii]
MCRWLAYSGAPVTLNDLLYKPANSLVLQSLHSRMGAEPTNGDGFGIGWYDGHAPEPGIFRSTEPAWSDPNLRELARHVRSGTVFAHVRATSGTAIQLTNCHPFRQGDWLFMHNGAVDRFPLLKRDLQLAVDPALFPTIEGTTDSETLFHLALTFGLTDDPPAAMATAVGLVEATGRRHGVDFPFQGTLAVTDGHRMWAVRYSSEGRSRTLFRNADVSVLRQHYPDHAALQGLSDDTRVIVSEPLGELRGAWLEVPEGTCLVVDGADEELHPFVPTAPAA